MKIYSYNDCCEITEARKKNSLLILICSYFQIPKVWIENPSEVRVAQWTNVSTENGMTQLKFALSPEPSPVRRELNNRKSKDRF